MESINNIFGKKKERDEKEGPHCYYSVSIAVIPEPLTVISTGYDESTMLISLH